MKIKRLVIGSGNSGKIADWKRLLSGVINVVGVGELGNYKDSKENGKTFEENAKTKASYYAKKTKEFVYSEDGGFEVDFLKGLPGIKSRRILPGNRDGTDKQLIDCILMKLMGVPRKKRKARLIVYSAISDPKGNIIFKDNSSIDGIITKKVGPILIKGYPYRSIFYIPKLKKTYAELNEEEYDAINHKKPIANRISKFLLEY